MTTIDQEGPLAFRVTCPVHALNRVVSSREHADNLLARHERIAHVSEPTTVNLSDMAAYLVVISTDPLLTHHASGVRTAWELLTGLKGEQATAYAQRVAATTVTAAVPPF